ncbi:MAG: hypothetical protein M3Z26_12985 [Bacteroidota bacterium]|nr:hypothetical protein [Bacteroidota bacterium]
MSKSSSYHSVYIKKDGEYVSLTNEASTFCEKWIKPIHSENWDWTIRDFSKPENDPTKEEARAIRDLIYKDLQKYEDSQIDLTGLTNMDCISAFMNPKSEYESMNMEEFAYALKVELEHGRVKDANVTSNHPFLTALIALAHMSESITYYTRLKIMEAEAEIYEINRKLNDTKFFGKGKLKDKIKGAETALQNAREAFNLRLLAMHEIPVLDEIED